MPTGISEALQNISIEDRQGGANSQEIDTTPPGEGTGRNEAPLFSFGVLSDVQYADIDDGPSYHGTPRFYRNSLVGLRQAVAAWQGQNVDFALHLGDIIDGKNAPLGQSEQALAEVLHEFSLLDRRVHHSVGNHCLYNFRRETLNKLLGFPPSERGSSYYSFSPHPEWRIVILDAFDVSKLGWPKGHELHEQAQTLLDVNNPNEDKNSAAGLEGPAKRFVEFGGGVSQYQLDWLEQELGDAKGQGQNVILACHLPLHPVTECNPICLLWNYEETLKVIHASGNVVAVLGGHTHKDCYGRDEEGVHHRVLNAVLETGPGVDCYGHVNVFSDRLELVGVGGVASTSMAVGSDVIKAIASRTEVH